MGLTHKAFVKTQKPGKGTPGSQSDGVPVPFLHSSAQYPLYWGAVTPWGTSFCCVSECLALTMAAGLRR